MKIKAKPTILIFLVLLFSSNSEIYGQPDNPPADINQEDFRAWLKLNWYDGLEDIDPNSSSGYTAARLKMYNEIDPIGDSLYGFYSDYSIYRPSTGFSSPGDISPMDCEHIVPQSVFNSAGPMKNDIHHLAPTFSMWNSTRGSLPFGDNEDIDTDKWMRYDNQIVCSGSASCPPDESIRDEFSEVINNGEWEPREEVKGNVARAVFYFYTMYPQFNINAIADIEELYSWHINDLPDAEEIERNDEVEDFQGNRNPYIDHTEWVYTAWIDSTTMGIFDLPATQIELFPNPAIESVYIKSEKHPLSFVLIDSKGRSQRTGRLYDTRQPIPLRDLQSGIYFIKTETVSGKLGFSSFIKQ